jgi:cbb3-type cytochrome oxidase maturation protein
MGETKRTKREWIALILGAWVVGGVAFAGGSFVYKIIEIVSTVPKGDAPGFAVIQVVTYLLVAVGFFFLFLWSFLKGDFKDLEGPKYRMLEREEELRRREESEWTKR